MIGDLPDRDETCGVADQVNALGDLDAVIHNAGVYAEPEPSPTADGHARILAVNVLALYLLTMLIRRPARLIYLSSDMHTGGHADLDDIEWTTRPWNGVQGYSDSKPFIATLAAAIARRGPTHPATPSTRLGTDPHGRSERTRRPHTATRPKSGWPPATNPPPRPAATSGTTNTNTPPRPRRRPRVPRRPPRGTRPHHQRTTSLTTRPSRAQVSTCRRRDGRHGPRARASRPRPGTHSRRLGSRCLSRTVSGMLADAERVLVV